MNITLVDPRDFYRIPLGLVAIVVILVTTIPLRMLQEVCIVASQVDPECDWVADLGAAWVEWIATAAGMWPWQGVE